MEDKQNPLVSVRVITYNSGKTVIETLESIKTQTYQNIELIISDDCSSDNTIEICKKWLEQNSKRFTRTKMLTVNKNTGVSANILRAEKACRGEWIKGIAGDDILKTDCIHTYIDYIRKHPSAIYIFSRCETFGGKEDNRKRVDAQFRYDFFSLSLQQQYERLVFEGNCIPAATNFYNRKMVEKLGVRYDARIPLLDDWPRWINLIKSGVHFDFIDKELVRYRVSDNALSTNMDNISPAYRKSLTLMYIYYQFPEEYKISSNKRETIYKYLRTRMSIADNKIVWHIICKCYKVLILHRW